MVNIFASCLSLSIYRHLTEGGQGNYVTPELRTRSGANAIMHVLKKVKMTPKASSSLLLIQPFLQVFFFIQPLLKDNFHIFAFSLIQLFLMKQGKDGTKQRGQIGIMFCR